MPKPKEVDLNRLCMAMQRSRLALVRYREERREAVRQYVGSHWSEEGPREKVPVNLIALYVKIVSRSLIAKDPRVMLATFDKSNKPHVSAMEKWANKEIEQIRYAETIQRIVIDALFSIGIAKVGLSTPADSAVKAFNLKAGQPFCDRVDLDDFLFDIHARDFREAGFMGHRYRVPLEVVRDSKIYGKGRKDLSPSTDEPYNLEGDERIGVLGRSIYATNSEEFEDFVDLWEVYVPRHRLLYTFADDHLTGATSQGASGVDQALRVQRWIGPDTGPYHVLAYGVVPGNAMPKAPIQDLIDLHILANQLYRKLMRQAERQKELLLVTGGAMEDGERTMHANDGEIVRCDNPEKSVPRAYGGPDQKNFAMFADCMQRFGYMAGNLDMMGGLSPQSKTASQDKMLEANASAGVNDMQDRTVTFVADVLKSLCWYWWHDPFKVMTAKHSLPGLPNMAIQQKVTPQQRMKIPFEELELEVDPYSMQNATPQARLQGLNQIVQTIITPMAQLLQAQGVALDVNAYLEKVGQYMNMPDLQEIMTMQEPPQGGGSNSGAGVDQPGMPAQTNRTYTRENVSARTQRGDQQNLVNSLMGVDTGGASNGQAQGQGQ